MAAPRVRHRVAQSVALFSRSILNSGSSGTSSSSSKRSFSLLFPGSNALAAAGCAELAVRGSIASFLLAQAGGGAPHTDSCESLQQQQQHFPPPLPPLSPARAAASLGAGALAAAAALPAAGGATALAFLIPSWGSRGGGGGYGGSGPFAPHRRVTDLLLAGNVAMYGLQQAYPGLVLKLARINHLVSAGQLWRLLTPALVHANLMHLGINSLSLALLGPTLEGILGRKRLLATYALSAVAGNALAWAMSSSGGWSMAVGASSSISGLFGALFAFKLLNRGSGYGMSGGDLSWFAQVVGVNALIQLGSRSVDGWSHLGGALGGAAAVWLMGPRPGKW